MANALVSMVVNKLREEVYLVGDAKEEVEKLSSTLESIQALLNDAEIMQFHNESMQVWLKKLKDVVYDVEDVLDEMIPFPESESGTHNGDDRLMGNQPWACLFSVFSCCGLEDWIRLAHESWIDGDDTDTHSIRDKFWTFFSKVASQRDFTGQIKQVRAKLDQIAADTSKFSFQLNNSFRGGSELDKAESQTSSLVDESQIHGRDEDRDTIISKLISGSSCEEGRICVISIAGVGGLGKTTLAQLICNDERVKSHFHKVLWVCVSDEFDVKMITRKIIEDAEGVNTKLTELNPLQKKLLKTLQGKRFLLVLDDVWNHNSEKWEQLWHSFQSGAPGSKILVTTRSEKVAITCKSAYMYKLEGLSDDDCWSLFSSRAFTGRKVVDCLALEKIGREIVNKCKGVPLSVKVIGSVMRSKRTAQDWQDILESETWEIPEIAKGILPALLLSYYNLPVHLKQCFTYCSVFPKDYVMEKYRLVRLWLAQGFIKPEGKREMEAIGGEYFDDLLAQSLFQKAVIEYEYGYEEKVVVKCTIHDLLHDLVQFITKNEYCIFEEGKSDSSSVTARHSSFIVRNTSKIPALLCDAKKLRTLFQIGPLLIDTIPDYLFQCARSLRALDLTIAKLPSSIGLLKHLRYLDLSNSLIVELPESVTHLRNLLTLKLNYCQVLNRLPRGMGKLVSLRHLEISMAHKLTFLPVSSIGLLKHLRYLDLSYTAIVELPESVTHLHNLQTLKLNYCRDLARLPGGMGKLVSLRHLEIAGTRELKCLPEGLGRISSLQTLSRFMVGDNGGCKIGELKRLNSLQGNLAIENLMRVGSGDEAKEAELDKKSHLCVLFLQMSLYNDDLEWFDADDVSWDGDHSDEILPDDDFEMSRGDDPETSGGGDPEMSGDNDFEISVDDEVERMDDVLEALRPPHTNLEKLVIENCIGSKFPTWMEDLPFSNLVDLRLIGCYKCTQLPGLGRLPSLKFLQIQGGLIKRVGHEFYWNSCGGGINGVAFPKLEELELSGMYELEEWELRLEDREIMPSLQTLRVYDCPKLKALPQHLLLRCGANTPRRRSTGIVGRHFRSRRSLDSMSRELLSCLSMLLDQSSGSLDQSRP